MYAPLNTATPTGYRPGVGLGYAAGGNGPHGGNRGWNPTMRGLGAISSDEAALLVADGLDAGEVQLASSLGATDSDAEYILGLNNQDAEVAALQQLVNTLNDAATGRAIAAAEPSLYGPAVTPPPSAAVGQSPAGSTLLYTATYSIILTAVFVTPTEIISELGNALSGTGLSIAGTQASSYSQNSFTVAVQDNIGHALLSDAQSVLDATLNSLRGVTKVSSSISLGVLGSGTPGVPAGGGAVPPVGLPATSFTTWIESNAGYVLAGVAAIVILPGLIKKF